MKPENVKIVQILTKEYSWYEATGGVFKINHVRDKFFGLGDDGKIYSYGKHSSYEESSGHRYDLGWKEILPESP